MAFAETPYFCAIALSVSFLRTTWVDSACAKKDPPKTDIKKNKNLIYQVLFFVKPATLATKNLFAVEINDLFLLQIKKCILSSK